MKENMAIWDRVGRIIISAVVAGLYITNMLPGSLEIILLVVAVVFVVTGFFGFCPTYSFFDFSTMKQGDEENQ